MSVWLEAIGWLLIPLGVYSTWQNSRTLVSGPYRRGELSRADRGARRKALTSLRWSLCYIASGVVWVTGWYTHPIVAWLLAGYVCVLVAYDVSAWTRSRRTRKSGGQTA